VIQPSVCNLVPIVMQLTASHSLNSHTWIVYDKMLSFDLTIFGVAVYNTLM